ncbi:MAG: ATP-dependent Clp protease proteolytic subunit [Bacteroidia bacterium]|nr:ATP-dependent Clp protease proteolytic subunit [Bacteroidia bacterium]
MAHHPKPKQRTLLISERIDKKLAGDIIRSIYEINEDDADKEDEYRNWKREPIRLLINSNGGSVYDGLGIISAMRLSQTPVHTYAMGSVMSMALFIYVSGHKRLVAPYTTFMYHQLSFFAWDKMEGIKEQIAEGERIEALCEALLAEHTDIKPEILDPYKKQKSEWYFSPQEALTYRVSDEMLSPVLGSDAPGTGQ